MGLGFVLLIYFVILSVAALGFAIYLGGKAYYLSIRSSLKTRLKRTAVAAVVPYLWLGYFGVAFIIYAIWCAEVRGVDPGLGDSWFVPIQHGYSLKMIDTHDSPFLARGNLSVLKPIELLGIQGRFLYGKTRPASPDRFHDVRTQMRAPENSPNEKTQPQYFLLNTLFVEMWQFESEEELHSAMKALGLEAPGEMQSATYFYFKRRWGFADAAAVALILALPAAVGFRTIKKHPSLQFWKRM